jgi:hypothetical protein
MPFLLDATWPTETADGKFIGLTAHTAIQSALRTLEAEASGVSAITAACHWIAPFARAAEMIRNARAG